MNKVFDTQTFIDKAKKIHGLNSFDYSKAVYFNSHCKLQIICNTCNFLFLKTPNNHLRGQGCPKCSREKNIIRLKKIPNKHTKSFEQFFLEAKKIHNNKYCYDKVIYKNNNTKIEINCNNCGNIFFQSPARHLKGNGCKKCSQTKTHKQFLIDANNIHGDKFIYLSYYENNRKKIQIECKSCSNIFFQSPSHHIAGSGCPKCNLQYKSNENYINQCVKIHGINKYDYVDTVYKNRRTKIKIKCIQCKQSFFQRADRHLKGNGCPRCSGSSISKISQRWLNWKEKTENILFLREYRIKIDNKVIVVDGFHPNTNTIYEFHGDFWHGNPKKFDPEKKNAFNKKTFGELFLETTRRSALIRNAGYNLISIWQSEWEEIEKNLLLKQTA